MKGIFLQEDMMGCGIACVGHILGYSSYSRAKKLFRNSKFKVGGKGFLCKELVRIINRSGKKYEYRYLRGGLRRKIYKPGVIVFIEKSKRYPVGHYLYRSRYGWVDSWINFPYIKKARAGVRKRLPGRPIYGIFPSK